MLNIKRDTVPEGHRVCGRLIFSIDQVEVYSQEKPSPAFIIGRVADLSLSPDDAVSTAVALLVAANDVDPSAVVRARRRIEIAMGG